MAEQFIEISENQVWFVKVLDDPKLKKFKILCIRDKVVMVKEFHGWDSDTSWYKLDDLEFVDIALSDERQQSH